MNMKDDYALVPVPDDRTVSGLRIAMVKIGIIIALPAFISGAEIGFSLGFEKGLLAIFFGGLLLSIIATATGVVGAKSRLSTAMIIKFTFGSLGGKLVSLILATTLLGWFGVTAELFGRSVHQILGVYGWNSFPEASYVVVGGLLMVFTTVFGFSALQRLSDITVPLLLVLIAYTAYIAVRQSSAAALSGGGNADWTLSEGISAIVGGLAAGVTIFPDLCRFSRSASDARLAAVLTFGIAMPFILLLALIPSTITHQRDLMVIMMTLGLGVPALVLLVVKAWATNAGNLYSASLSAASLFPQVNQKLIVTVAGAIGIIIAAVGITQQFIPFLVVLGIAIPPIAGIFVADFFFVRGASYDIERVADLPPVFFGAFACWAFGIAIAVAARLDWLTFTGISACDSMVAASLAYLLLRKLRPHSVSLPTVG